MIDDEKEALLQKYIESYKFYEAKRSIWRTYQLTFHPIKDDEIDRMNLSPEARTAFNEQREALEQFKIAQKKLRDYLTGKENLP